MLALVAVVFAQIGDATWSSGRPPECSSLLGLDANVWERAKSPELREYCDLVASASSKLSGTAVMADSALEAARRAETLLPGRAAARALEGRALVALGQAPSAVVAFRDAVTKDARVLDDPPALLAWARALARIGHSEEASGAYRALLPRSSSLSSADRAAAALEAGLVAMSRGPAGLDEAVAALRDAMRQADGETALVAAVALALARDRGGAREEAQSLMADRVRGDPRVWLSTAMAQQILSVASSERFALIGFGLQPARAVEARQAWQQYLASAPDSPWAAHAKRCLEVLRPRGFLPRGAP
jgi:tetratricopeptide (TPR) repeat protein